MSKSLIQPLKIALAQCNFHVGDIPGNTERIATAAQRAAESGAGLIVFSELAITGYPPEDLLLRPSLALRVQDALEQVARISETIAVAVGYPMWIDDRLYNCAGVWNRGECIAQYCKQELPN